jgi:hypothetical protein
MTFTYLVMEMSTILSETCINSFRHIFCNLVKSFQCGTWNSQLNILFNSPPPPFEVGEVCDLDVGGGRVDIPFQKRPRE